MIKLGLNKYQTEVCFRVAVEMVLRPEIRIVY